MSARRLPPIPRVRSAAAVCAALIVPAALAPGAHAACAKPLFADPNMVVVCPADGIQATFVVPAGVRKLRVIATGGAGGNGSASVVRSGGTLFLPGPPCDVVRSGGPGGAGALASGELRVRPGRRLYVVAGGRGATQQGPAGGAGGFNGGAAGGVLRFDGSSSNYLSGGGGGGGGASDVRTCAIANRSCDTLASRLIVAAGGGGGGGDIPFSSSFGGVGGSGGGAPGEGADGSAPDGGAGGPGGGAATATAGGTAGSTGATAGTRGTGGRGADYPAIIEGGGGGGGGGGLFGGGGGAAGADRSTAGAGGGGGSSFGPRGTRFAPAGRLEPGSVTIFYLPTRVRR